MELLEQLQDNINKLNNEQKTYAILVDSYIWNELLITKVKEIDFSDVIPKFNSVIIEKESSVNGFKLLTKKEYDKWKNKRCKI